MYNRKGIQSHILSFIDFSKASTFLDIGCGKGYDLIEISNRAYKEAKLYGVDVKTNLIEFAKMQTERDCRFTFDVYDVEDGLKFEDESIDVIVSCNVLECIKNKSKLLHEIHRVLKPDGKIIMAHFDWDTQIFNAFDKNLYRKLITTYNDWQQPWMNDCDAWMGRKISGIFNETGLFNGTMFTYVVTESEYKEGFRGYSLINEEFKALVEKGIIENTEFELFKDQITQIEKTGHYFYSINLYTYVGQKK
ncbi:hypothetical protein MSBR3_0148 [Methanosarcina barkeri 3]|uniref:Arsenite methyltransferase n=1 Tax=Methanosarcina barkeri 3 TaxID=1434107 RepID=A0A0E3SHL3_METBA|nr:class I SAM-dependent methyltransferase [Methanosarcina barkeri]AKB80726.1 hypothetical protein MSBR3_0148 [Methanosarcina barkeri 3]